MPAQSAGHYALAATVAVTFAGCYSAIRIGGAFAPPLRFASLRAALAGTVLVALLGVRRARVVPPRRTWGAVLALALVGTVGGFGAMFLSQRYAGAGIASVLGNTGPVMVIALAALFLGERVTRTKAVALALGFAGVLLIALGGGAAGPPSAAGIALPLVAAFGGASESVIVKRARVGDAVLSVAAWQFLAGAVALWGLSTLFESGAAVQWTPTFAGALLFLAVPGTAFGTALWYWLVQREDVGRLTLVLFLVPVAGLALAAALFGEGL
ncbi:MAG: DMT family transporter, partial [Gemmatimonadota bacterium]|nr:DMT family transporter [Gemmatimonadota bacterium]